MDNLKPTALPSSTSAPTPVRLVVMSAIPGYAYRLEDEIRESCAYARA